MKILKVYAKNFGSYKSLDYQLKDNGLTLVSGPTGAGKSTLCDLIPWVLFGATAKNGTVDEIIRWNSETSTKVTVYVTDINNILFTITRTRKPNDLYYTGAVHDERHHRGKDLNDTQKLINNRLGFNLDTYLTGAYYHEFSQTATFFSTSAKNRRTITEQLVDLSLAKNLTENITSYNKDLKKQIQQQTQKLSHLEYMKTTQQKLMQTLQVDSMSWSKNHKEKIERTKMNSSMFEEEKANEVAKLIGYNNHLISDTKQRIEDLTQLIKPQEYYKVRKQQLKQANDELGDEICVTCGSKKDNAKRLLLAKESYKLGNEEIGNNELKNRLEKETYNLNLLKAKEGQQQTQIQRELNRTNPYNDQVVELVKEDNPYESRLEECKIILETHINSYNTDKLELQNLKLEQDDLDLLLDITNDFRILLVKNTIVELESNTNKMLEVYLDAELRVNLEVIESDKIEVVMLKDGNECAYTQLSKGQRQILNLCFGLSVMKLVQLHNSVSFNTVFLDEVLSGLDENMKLKSFNLLKSLEQYYDNIYVVEHSEQLKTMFTNRIDVILENGESKIEET